MKKPVTFDRIALASLLLAIVGSSIAATHFITKELGKTNSELAQIRVMSGSWWTNRDQSLFTALAERSLLAEGVDVQLPTVAQIKEENTDE